MRRRFLADMVNDKRQKTKEAILQATIECVNEEGLNGATIRKIAEYAGVNSSAISYYFGSRDALIEKVMEKTLDNAFDFNDFTFEDDEEYKQVLKEILEHWKGGALNYPGITHAHFNDIINKHTGSEATLKRVNRFIDKTYELLTQHGLSETKLNYKKLKLIFSAFIATILIPDAAYPGGCYDQTDVLIDML